MLTLKNSGTFRNELYLRKPPIPKLKDVIKYYLDVLCPLMKTHVFFNFKRELENLMVDDYGVIDAYLERSTSHLKNWMETWWLENTYLKVETEVIPFGSLTGLSSLYNTQIWPLRGYDLHKDVGISLQVSRGARYIRALLLLWSSLRQETVVPERDHPFNRILSMNSYRSLFNSARVQMKNGSARISRSFATLCEGGCPNFILFSIKGHVFEINFIEGEVIWPIENMEETLTTIIEYVSRKGSRNSVTPITTLTKSMLKGTLQYVNSSHQLLQDMNEAILWVSFDTMEPNVDNTLDSIIAADCQNRCGTKSLSLIVFLNGVVALFADAAILDPEILKTTIDFADNHIKFGFTEDNYSLQFKYMDGMRLSSRIWSVYDLEVPDILDNELGYMRRVFNSKAYSIYSRHRYFKWFNRTLAQQWQVDPLVTVHLLILMTHYELVGSFTTSCAVISHRRYYRGRLAIVPTLFSEIANFMRASKRPKRCSPIQLKPMFWQAHQRLKKALRFGEEAGSPVSYLNYLVSTCSDIMGSSQPLTSLARGLQHLTDNDWWDDGGFSGRFYIQTYYLGEGNTLVQPPPTLRDGAVFSYSVDDESTLLSISYRNKDDYIRSIWPSQFMHEFVSSVELLNQIFI